MAGSGEDVGTTLKKKCHCLDVADFSSLEQCRPLASRLHVHELGRVQHHVRDGSPYLWHLYYVKAL